jgi:type VI secretion system protein ImpM
MEFSMSSLAVIRLFGKLPAHGDFVSRGITPSERDRLDMWLSDEMREARARFGEDFDVRYDTAPPWLFAHGEEGGVLCPSVDAAGRRFPLLVGRSSGSGASANGCAEVAYEALAETLTADDVVMRVNERETSDQAETPQGWWPFEAPELAAFAGEKQPAGLLSRMLELAPA